MSGKSHTGRQGPSQVSWGRFPPGLTARPKQCPGLFQFSDPSVTESASDKRQFDVLCLWRTQRLHKAEQVLRMYANEAVSRAVDVGDEKKGGRHNQR